MKTKNLTNNHHEVLKNAAIKYIDQSKTIIPLYGKKPLISGWAKDDYTSTEDDVTRWTIEFKDKFTGIGIKTGYMEDLFVLDIDKEQDLSKLDLPEKCVQVKSGGDGMHYYFSDIGEDSSEFTSANLRKNGIEGDVKGNNQYIVAPPSRHPDTGKMYEWVTPVGSTELTTAPEWLIKILAERKIKKTDWSGSIREQVLEGSRHDTAVRLAGKLLHHIPQRDWDEIVYTTLSCWNETMCHPPLPKDELQSIYESLGSKQKKQQKDSETPNSEIEQKQPMSVVEIFSMPESEKPTFLIEGLIPEIGITAIAGHPGCGKSWMMMAIAKSVATGENFLKHDGMKTIKTNVLIVDEESGVWEMKRRMELLEFNSETPIHFCCQYGFKLNQESNVSHLIEICKKHKIGLIIFDPFAAMHTGVENNAEEMQLVMGAMQKFNEAGITVVFIHHHRKGGVSTNGLSLRGSSAILGRLDSLIIVNKSENETSTNITLIHEKSRRGKNTSSIKVNLIQKDDTSPIELLYAGKADEVALKKDKAKSLVLELLKYEQLLKDEIVSAISEEDEIGSRNINQALKELEQAGEVTLHKKDRKNIYSLKTSSEDL